MPRVTPLPSGAPTVLEPATAARRYLEVRHATEALARPLSPEDCQAQSMADASPVKWHLAHTSWFFETFVLERSERAYRPFHPEFRVLFNSYYQTVGDQYARPMRGLLTRPTLDEVAAYRRHVDEHVLALLSRRDVDDETLSIVRLGLEHEQQHQELILTDLKHLLSVNPLRPVYRTAPASAAHEAPASGWHRSDEAIRSIGHEGSDFCFDNETPRHRVLVGGFEIASRPVTNGDYEAFIDDGGYERPELWLSDGWSTVRSRGWTAPLYWERRDGRWCEFTLGGLRDVERAAPVCHVSFYEADAFARWAGARLPSEAEWESVAATETVAGNFVEAGLLHPTVARASGDRPAQLFGDVWEWTSSAYAPYPGYRPPSGALGEYNGKFMCNQLVLRGGSCATPASHVRATYRNFFYPDARWQFSGIRLARDVL